MGVVYEDNYKPHIIRLIYWMQLDVVREKFETMGCTIEGIGISEGNCYQVSGLNVQAQHVAYFDLQTGGVVQEGVAQRSIQLE